MRPGIVPYLAGHSGLEPFTLFLSPYSLADKMGHNQTSLYHFCKIPSENGTNGTASPMFQAVFRFTRTKAALASTLMLI